MTNSFSSINVPTLRVSIYSNTKQECIPVGCVPPAAVAVGGSPPAPPDQAPQEQAPPWDQAPHSGPDPPVDRHTPVNILPCPKLRLRAVIISECRWREKDRYVRTDPHTKRYRTPKSFQDFGKHFFSDGIVGD